MKWLTAKQVAAKMSRTTRVFREKIATKPGFPTPTRPGGGHPLWREDEVDEWLESFRDAPRRHPSTAGNTPAAEP